MKDDLAALGRGSNLEGAEVAHLLEVECGLFEHLAVRALTRRFAVLPAAAGERPAAIALRGLYVIPLLEEDLAVTAHEQHDPGLSMRTGRQCLVRVDSHGATSEARIANASLARKR